MSLRREVLIRIIALLQKKTLIETKNCTLKCLKRHYSTMRSMKNVAVFTEDGAFALFFRPSPGGFDSSRVSTPGNLPSKANKNVNARGSARGRWGGGGVLSAAGIDWCIKGEKRGWPKIKLDTFTFSDYKLLVLKCKQSLIFLLIVERARIWASECWFA